MYPNFKIHSSPLFLCFFILNIKKLALRLEIGMRFNALYNESYTESHVVEIYEWWKLQLFHIVIEWKSIHYFACGLEIPLSTTLKCSTLFMV